MKYRGRKYTGKDYDYSGSYEEYMIHGCDGDNAENHSERSAGKGILRNNAGIGVVEIILILVILIALVLIFREKITAIVDGALQAIETDSGTIIGTDK